MPPKSLANAVFFVVIAKKSEANLRNEARSITIYGYADMACTTHAQRGVSGKRMPLEEGGTNGHIKGTNDSLLSL